MSLRDNPLIHMSIREGVGKAQSEFYCNLYESNFRLRWSLFLGLVYIMRLTKRLLGVCFPRDTLPCYWVKVILFSWPSETSNIFIFPKCIQDWLNRIIGIRILLLLLALSQLIFVYLVFCFHCSAYLYITKFKSWISSYKYIHLWIH